MTNEPNSDDRKRFGRIMAVLAETFGRDLTSLTIPAYFSALEDLPIESVEKVSVIAMRVCKFFPKPAELRELLIGSKEDAAERAWLLFLEAAGKIGRYGSLKCDDPAFAKAILDTFQSWPEACRQTGTEVRGDYQQAEPVLSEEMLRAKQKQFCGAYRRALQFPSPVDWLPGLHEIQNHQVAPEQLSAVSCPAGIVQRGQIIRAFLKWDEQGRIDQSSFQPVKPLSELSPPRSPILLSDGRSKEELRRDVLDGLKLMSSNARISEPVAAPLTEREIEKRRIELRRQADKILAEQEPPKLTAEEIDARIADLQRQAQELKQPPVTLE